MARADRKANRQAKRKDARTRVGRRLKLGKNVNASKIAEKAGVSEKRAQKIIDRGERKARRNHAQDMVNNRIEKNKGLNAWKIAHKTGVSEKRAQKIIDRGGQKNTFTESKKTDTPVKTAKYQSGQQYYSDGKLVDMGPPNKEKPGQDNNPYTVKNIQNFDLTAGGAGAKKGTERLSAQDIKRLRTQGGFSRKELVDYADNTDFGDGPGASGGKAQALLSKYKDAIAEKKDKKNKEQPVAEDARLGSEEEVTPPAPPAPVEKTSVVQTGENNFTNTGEIFGNINQGADFSVNIGGDASDNMKNALSYSAINDNAFARSQSQMNGLSRSAQAIKAADALTNADQEIANTDYATGLNSLYLGAKGTKARTQLYGDMFKFDAPDWQQPDPYKKPKDKTKKIADMYKD